MASLFWLDTHRFDTFEYIYFGAVCRLGRGYSGDRLYCDHGSVCVAAYERAARIWHHRFFYIVIGLMVSTIGSTAFTFANKIVFQRARPIDILLQEHTYSFPSGHATISIALLR